LTLAGALTTFGCTRQIVNHDSAWTILTNGHGAEIEIEGVKVHTIDLGSGEPVVMIHGMADSAYSWRANAAGLVAAGFRLLLIDQPGLGESSIPPDGWSYAVEHQAEVILRAVDAAGIGRFRLVGHSLGGAVALQLALRHPERVSRVVALDPACFRVSCGFGRATTFLAHVAGTRWFTRLGLRSAYFRPERLDEAAVDEYARRLDAPGHMAALGSICRTFFSPEFDRMTESYGALQLETLLIWGAHDTWHPLAMGERLHAQIPRSRLELIAEAGHNPHQERPDLVNPVLVAFLRGEDQPR